MSTRCQIDFIKKWKPKGEEEVHEEIRRVYRHSDGYLEGVIPDLLEFLWWNEGRNDDPEYAAANFIYWSKNKTMESIRQVAAKQGKSEQEAHHKMNLCSKLGFGVCNNDCIHGVIEYFYEVICNENGKLSIKAYKVPRLDCQSKDEFELLNQWDLASFDADGFSLLVSLYTARNAVEDGVLIPLQDYKAPESKPVYITRNLFAEGGYEQDPDALRRLVEVGLDLLKLPDVEDERSAIKLRVIEKDRKWVIEDGENVTFMKPEDY